MRFKCINCNQEAKAYFKRINKGTQSKKRLMFKHKTNKKKCVSLIVAEFDNGGYLMKAYK